MECTQLEIYFFLKFALSLCQLKEFGIMNKMACQIHSTVDSKPGKLQNLTKLHRLVLPLPLAHTHTKKEKEKKNRCFFSID